MICLFVNSEVRDSSSSIVSINILISCPLLPATSSDIPMKVSASSSVMFVEASDNSVAEICPLIGLESQFVNCGSVGGSVPPSQCLFPLCLLKRALMQIKLIM